MTTICAPMPYVSQFPVMKDFGHSPEAKYISDTIKEIEDGLSSRVTVKPKSQIIEAKIDEAVIEYYQDTKNKHKHIFDVISAHSYLNSYLFAKILPSSIPVPNIYVDTDGMIEYEWYVDAKHLFSITIEGKNSLIYAGIFGNDSQTHGTERFGQELPSTIYSYIQKLYPRS